MLNIPPPISSASAIRGLCGSLLFFGTVSVIGRLLARASQKSQYRADDWTMILSWLAFAGLCSCLLAASYAHTLGYSPQKAAPYHPSAITNAAITIAVDQFGALCLGFAKISALLFFKRVFCVADAGSAFKTVIKIGVIIVACWTVTFMVFPLAYCGTHFDGYWIRPVYNEYCKPAHQFLLSGSGTDLVLDVFVVILPIPKIWGLQTTVRRRLAVMLIFLTALLSLGASAAKMAIIGKLAVNPVTDPAVAAFANSAVFFMWTLEAGAAIVAINMPSLWYFRTRKMPEKMVRSFRSIMSLRSMSLKGSQGSGKATEAGKDASRAASSAQDSTCNAGRMEEGLNESAIRVHIDGCGCPTVNPRGSDWNSSQSKDNIKVTSQISQVVEER